MAIELKVNKTNSLSQNFSAEGILDIYVLRFHKVAGTAHIFSVITMHVQEAHGVKQQTHSGYT
jgi:hypothetical protein